MIFPPPLLVRGHAQGAVAVFPSVPDVGTRYVFSGTGNMSPMGRVLVRGSIQTSSFTGQPAGMVTLANQFGRVQLQITGRAGPDGSNSYQFEVASATGRFANLEGTGGVLELKAPDRVGRGRFEMEINPFIILSGRGG
jgi:hypothetical protein